MGDARPALEYLLACSDVSLESFRISRMNQAANLRRQVRALVDQWVEAEVDAGVSQWMLECRRPDTALPELKVDCPQQNKSPKHSMISFQPARMEASAIFAQQKRLSTDLGEIGDAAACPSTEGGTLLPDEYKKASHANATRLRKVYAKPIARKCLMRALEEAGIAMPVPSSPRAQQELTFEGPLAFGTTADEAREIGISHAIGKRCPLSTEQSLHRAPCSHAETHGCQLTQ